MGAIRVFSDRDISEADATSGMIREEAISDPGYWAGVIRAAPGRQSEWHSHGDYETYFYVVSGRIQMESGPGGTDAVEAGPGDFVHVPPRLVHRELNPGPDEGMVILFRAGTGAPVINVSGPEPPS
jgi:uncharacterized RmlC-like cupin family protein